MSQSEANGDAPLRPGDRIRVRCLDTDPWVYGHVLLATQGVEQPVKVQSVVLVFDEGSLHTAHGGMWIGSAPFTANWEEGTLTDLMGAEYSLARAEARISIPPAAPPDPDPS